MKLTLNEVMGSLRVVCAPDGYELHSPAGVAYYDKNGVRNRVNGVPEYFPLSLSVHTATDNKLGKLGGKDGGVSMGWNIQLQASASALIAMATKQEIQANAWTEELSALKAKASDDDKSLAETIRDAIKKESQPGGLIYNGLRYRR